MPDVINDPSVDQITEEQHPVPPVLGECPRCSTTIYPIGLDWQGTYRHYYMHNNVNASRATDQQWAPCTLDDGTLMHYTCTAHCDACNKRKPWGGFENVENNDMCKDCYVVWSDENPDAEVCYSCETYVASANDLEYSSWLSESICLHCHDNRYYECGECGYEDHHYNMEEHICERDIDDVESNSNIHSYSYKPRPKFHGDAKYYLGVELEVECRDSTYFDDAANYVADKTGFGYRGYLKSDGSLSYGFEIVTHPHSLKEMQESFPWADILSKLKSYRFRSWNTSTCGLHVHVSRSAFGGGTITLRESHQIRFMKLIYDNERQITRLAGRSSNYATFSDKGKIIPKVKNGEQSNGRYAAINIENDETLEVRVFRGSLRYERVLSAIELVHAAVEYTRDLKMSVKHKPLSWARFVAYVSEHSDTYPNLFIIMNELFDRAELNTDDQGEN
jgi:hypothetical protein